MRESWKLIWGERIEDLNPDFVQFMEEEIINRYRMSAYGRKQPFVNS